MKAKVRKTYNFLIRLLIISLTYGFIYRQVFGKGSLPELYDNFADSFRSVYFLKILLLLLFLAFFNWALEALKWQLLIYKIERVSWSRSLQAVLTGVAVSSFTPNRVGDYFGRVFILEKANHIEGILITIVGSMSQLLVTFVMGTSGIYLMLLAYPDTLLEYFGIADYLYTYFLWGGAVLIIGLNVLLTLLFLNISMLSSLARRLKGKMTERILSYIHVLSAYTVRELLLVIALSLLRFVVFSTQLYFLFRLFGIILPYGEAMVIIAVIFFVMTMIPTIAITELGIRGSVSLFLLGIYFGHPMHMAPEVNLGIVAATSSLWIINLALPALTGAIFVFNLKFFRKS